MVFIADAFAGWLIGQLANAGWKRLGEWLRGSEQERALQDAAAAAIQATAQQLRPWPAPPDDERSAEHLARVIDQVFETPTPAESLTDHATLLQGLQARVGERLATLEGIQLTSAGQTSAAALLGVSASTLTDMLTFHLLQELIASGARGGPLTPLADQLNHDLTHLQGQQHSAILERLMNELRAARATPPRLDQQNRLAPSKMSPQPGRPIQEPSGPIRVLIVDDHALFRRGLEMVLEQEDDVEVVGEAGDGAEAIEKAQELMPDVVLMDIAMPLRSGIEATQTIKDLIPHAKILMLTVSNDEANLYDALKRGATGYLLKEISIEEVANAIRSVAQGHVLISEPMASKLLDEFAAMVKRADEKQQVRTPRLTDREMEVLKLVAKGHNDRDIAKRLHISENTVRNHLRDTIGKLQLHSRMEAVVYAVREKLLEIK